MPGTIAQYQLMVTPPGGSATDMTSYVVWDQWEINQEYGRQGATALFVLEAPFGDGGIHESPFTSIIKPMSTLTFKDLTIGAFLFGGICSDPYMVYLSATLVQYWMQCVDYTYYADSVLVTASLDSMSAGAMFAQLTTQADCGITPSPSNPGGPTIDNLQIDHLQLTDAWDQISNLASWKNDYAWYVDENLVGHWGSELDAPLSGITVYDDLVVGGVAPTQTIGYIDKGKMFRYEWDGSSLRNSCIVRGANKQKTTTDMWQGDGVTSQWQLTFDLDSTGTITLTVGGVAKTISVVSDPTKATTQFALVQAPNGQWSLTLGTASAPGSVTISLAYTYNQPIIASYTNTLSTGLYTGPNHGLFEIYLSDNTLTTPDVAYSRARAEVAQYGFVQERFTFTTVANWPGHIRVGEVFTLNSLWIPDAQNNYNVGFTDYYIVTRNRIHGVEGGYREYEITAVRQHNLI